MLLTIRVFEKFLFPLGTYVALEKSGGVT